MKNKNSIWFSACARYKLKVKARAWHAFIIFIYYVHQSLLLFHTQEAKNKNKRISSTYNSNNNKTFQHISVESIRIRPHSIKSDRIRIPPHLHSTASAFQPPQPIEYSVIQFNYFRIRPHPHSTAASNRCQTESLQIQSDS